LKTLGPIGPRAAGERVNGIVYTYLRLLNRRVFGNTVFPLSVSMNSQLAVKVWALLCRHFNSQVREVRGYVISATEERRNLSKVSAWESLSTSSSTASQ
jgi:hypothetical protein